MRRAAVFAVLCVSCRRQPEVATAPPDAGIAAPSASVVASVSAAPTIDPVATASASAEASATAAPIGLAGAKAAPATATVTATVAAGKCTTLECAMGAAAPKNAPTPAGGGGDEFDKAAVAAALKAVSYSDCGPIEEPAKVSVTFAPSGTVTTAAVSGETAPAVKTCVADRFKQAKVSPFGGDAKTVAWSLRGASTKCPEGSPGCADQTGIKSPE
jgi:hypothetical protein